MMQHPKLYMAPLKGCTDHIFRNIFADHFDGFDVAVSPFIASKRDHKMKKKYVKDVLPEYNTRLQVIPQILSKSANDFIFLANYLYDLGHDTVNWNLGCPYPRVAKKKRGSGMLPHADTIHTFLDTVVPGIEGELSIKIRLGWRTTDDIFNLIPIFNQYPLKDIIIHPRTGLQRYSGEVDHEAFSQCLELIRHKVIYNGDIKTPEIFKALSLRFDRVSDWMIGRWCLANPFLPGMIKTGKDDIQDKIQRMQQFHDALFDGYRSALDGPAHLLNKMKGLWNYFSLSFKDCAKAMKKIKKSRSPDQYMERVHVFFDTDAKWQPVE